jgi:biotin-dependent carboxylase-like uncharacterized protein
MLKILKGGIESVVEDWPGRTGRLRDGMALSGAMDNVACQLGQLLVGNPIDEAGIEVTAGGFQAEFGSDALIAITGADLGCTINKQEVPLWKSFKVNKGDVIKFKMYKKQGFRAYLNVAGGIDVPKYLGSKSTCLFGAYGGHEGRKLKTGDELKFGKPYGPLEEGKKVKESAMPKYGNYWELKSINGPNSSPNYVTPEGMYWLFDNVFDVGDQANRAGIYLGQVDEEWFFAQRDVGHPSNVIEHPYNVRGGLNIAASTPILFPSDGPSLGGYICVLSVIHAELWKMGQLIPGRDKIKFIQVSQDEANEERLKYYKWMSADSIE